MNNNSTHVPEIEPEKALDEPLYAISSGRAFFRRMLQMRRNFLTPCTLIRTQGKKLQADMALCGRSMVEMLGVLAIVGVLSIGAIAGYSKAMMKHKLNKHRETYSFLLNNAIQLSANLPKSTSIAALKYTHVLHKLNLIPDGMTYHDQSSSIEEKGIIKDIFQNEITLLSSKGYGYEWSLSSSIPNTSYSFDICVNLVAVAQAYASDIIALFRSDYANGTTTHFFYYYGHDKCAEGKKPCLKDLTVNQISSICQVYKNNDKGVFTYSFWW